MKPSRKSPPKRPPTKAQLKLIGKRPQLPAKAADVRLHKKKPILDEHGGELPVTTEAEWRKWVQLRR